MVNKPIISIPDLVKRWGKSRNWIWKGCTDGSIPATKIGERWYVDMDWVHKTETIDNKPSTSNLEPSNSNN